MKVRSNTSIQWMLRFVYMTKKLTALAIILNVIFAIFTICQAQLFKNFFDTIQENNKNQLIYYVLMLLLVTLLQTIIHYISSYLSKYINSLTNKNMSSSFVKELIVKSQHEIDKYENSEIFTLVNNDIEFCANVCSSTLIRGIHVLLRFLIYAGYLFFLNPYISIISILIGPAILLLGRIFTPIIKANQTKMRESDAIQNSFISSIIQHIHLVKISIPANFIMEKFNVIWDKRLKIIAKTNKNSIAYDEISSLLGMSGNILTLALGALFYIRGVFSIGSMVAYMQIVNQVIWPFVEMSNIWNDFLKGLASANRIVSFFDLDNEIAMEANEIMKDKYKKENENTIEFSNVEFVYKKTDKIALNNISFTIYSKSIVGIHGKNGSGKSTIAKLISGLYASDNGRIIINDIESTNANITRIRDNVQYIMQSNGIMNASILDNICLGKEISTEQIEIITKELDLHEFIMELPDEYNFIIKDNNLSGGQLQKIVLARAMLQPKPIIILDEASSNLDMSIKIHIKKWLSDIKGQYTIIIICHDYYLSDLCDNIFVLQDGRIIQEGKHIDLFTKDGVYKTLYNQEKEIQAKRVSD